MSDKKAAKADIKEENKNAEIVLTTEDVQKKVDNFINIYYADIKALNKILSKYEDKIAFLEDKLFELSFNLKEIQINNKSE